MKEDTYGKLREHLDSLPCGMPETESGVEKRILQELFAPEEAEKIASENPFIASIRVYEIVNH